MNINKEYNVSFFFISLTICCKWWQVVESERLVKVAAISVVDTAYITLPAIPQMGTVIVDVLQDMYSLSATKVCVIICSVKWILIQLESRVLGNLLKQVYIFFYKRFHALKIKYVNNTYTFGNTIKATTCRVQNNLTLYLS